MTSARLLSGLAASFWVNALPFASDYVAGLNRHMNATDKEPCDSEGLGVDGAGERRLEASFNAEVVDRWCAKALTEGGSALLDGPVAEDVIESARDYVRRFSGDVEGLRIWPRSVLAKMAGFTFAALADIAAGGTVSWRPMLPGLGVCSPSECDYVCGDCLCEVKNVNRPVRSADIRQLVLYLTLNHCAGDVLGLRRIALINPRTKMLWVTEIATLLRGVSGSPSRDVLEDVADFLVGRAAYEA